jgi:hypothetical protein
MEFFSALEQKKIVLGDTLLHIGARLGYDEVVEFLLEQKVPTEIPNFQGILVKGCCATTCLRIVFDDCADVHELFGTDYKEEDKIHRMIRSMRRVWPLWMFEGQQEAGLLVRVLLDIRTSHTAFANLLKLTLSLSDRYRFLVSQEGLRLALELLQQHQGNAHEAKHTFTSQWNTEKKRTWLFQVFLKLFRSWKWRKNEERDCFYIDFLDSAMEAWINICEELHLNKKDLLPDAIVLKKYDLQIWKRRLHPPTAYLEELCVHINGLETYLQLTNLQAYN